MKAVVNFTQGLPTFISSSKAANCAYTRGWVGSFGILVSYFESWDVSFPFVVLFLVLILAVKAVLFLVGWNGVSTRYFYLHSWLLKVS